MNPEQNWNVNNNAHHQYSKEGAFEIEYDFNSCEPHKYNKQSMNAIQKMDLNTNSTNDTLNSNNIQIQQQDNSMDEDFYKGLGNLFNANISNVEITKKDLEYANKLHNLLNNNWSELHHGYCRTLRTQTSFLTLCDRDSEVSYTQQIEMSKRNEGPLPLSKYPLPSSKNGPRNI